jgi:FAD/FMN-containing dehydrogenase
MMTANGEYVTIDEAAVGAFREQLRGPLLQPGDAGYDEARRVWNAMIDKHPALIARCTGVADVIAAVNFARTYRLRVAIRGGGHNVAGSAICEGGLVIDTSPMKGVHVDPQARTVRAQAGATWGDVDRETQVSGLATPGGEVSVTGIAGLTLGGGVGYLRRKHGLTIDNLRAVEMVTADGQVTRASATEHPDLFWALRGGGVNLGVVTSFEYDLHPVGPEVMTLSIFYPLAEAPRVLRAWRDFTATAPDEASTALIFWSIPAIPEVPEELHGQPVVMLDGMYAGSVEAGERLFQPLRELGTPLIDESGPAPYTAAQSAFDWAVPEGLYYYWTSLYCNELDDALSSTLLQQAAERSSPRTLLVMRHMGGAVGRVPVENTAFGNRDAAFMLSFDACWENPAESEQHIAWTRARRQETQALTRGGGYINFPGFHEDRTALLQAHSSNYERLTAVQQQYDPYGVFRA